LDSDDEGRVPYEATCVGAAVGGASEAELKGVEVER
jgi:hypothetical protein